MKEQYVGDINDYRKLALLRKLADDGKCHIGICWMLTPPDDRTDGNRTGYLEAPDSWSHYDPELFDLLKPIAHGPKHRRLHLVEQAKVVPGANYFYELVPVSPSIRSAYMAEALTRLRKAKILFFDPDNGLQVQSASTGSKSSPKYVYRSEVLGAFERGHSVLVYQHFPREHHAQFRQRQMTELAQICRGSNVWCFETTDVAFLLIVHPEHSDTIGTRVSSIGAAWKEGFMECHGPQRCSSQAER